MEQLQPLRTQESFLPESKGTSDFMYSLMCYMPVFSLKYFIKMCEMSDWQELSGEEIIVL